VTTLDRSRGRTWDLAERYGASRFCLGVHACGIPVLELESDLDAVKKITAACRFAVEDDASDAVVLGCAGMTHLCAEISADIGALVVDGVQAATLMVQSLVTMGLRTGARCEFAPPPPKPALFGIAARLRDTHAGRCADRCHSAGPDATGMICGARNIMAISAIRCPRCSCPRRRSS
jgi:hypothetical protein